MTHEDAGHYADKHPRGTEVPEKWMNAVRKAGSKDGSVTCSAAHRIAKGYQTEPSGIGTAIDLLEYRIKKCQLGLFGYSPEKKIVEAAATVPAEIEAEIRRRVSANRISCLDCWEAAEQLSVSKMDVAAICERLAIKIKPCQLGAF